MPVRTEDLNIPAHDLFSAASETLKALQKAARDMPADITGNAAKIELQKKQINDLEEKLSRINREILQATQKVNSGGLPAQQVSQFNKSVSQQIRKQTGWQEQGNVQAIIRGQAPVESNATANLRHAQYVIEQAKRQRQDDDQSGPRTDLHDAYHFARNSARGGIGGWFNNTMAGITNARTILKGIDPKLLQEIKELKGVRFAGSPAGALGDQWMKQMVLGQANRLREAQLTAKFEMGITKIFNEGGPSMGDVAGMASGWGSAAKYFGMANAPVLGAGLAIAGITTAASSVISGYNESWTLAQGRSARRAGINDLIQDQFKQRTYGNYVDPVRARMLERLRDRMPEAGIETDLPRGRGRRDPVLEVMLETMSGAKNLPKGIWNWRKNWWNQAETSRYEQLSQQADLSAFDLKRTYGIDARHYTDGKDDTNSYYRHLAKQNHHGWYGDQSFGSWIWNDIPLSPGWLSGNREANVKIQAKEEYNKRLEELRAERKRKIEDETNSPLHRMNTFQNMQHLRAVENDIWESSLAWVQS